MLLCQIQNIKILKSAKMENSTFADRNETYFVDFIEENTYDNFTNSSMLLSNDSITPISNPDKQIQALAWIYASETYGDYYKIIFPITFIVCVFGIATNCLNIIIFTRKSMVNSINYFLTALSVTNIALMLTQIPYTIYYFESFRNIFNYNNVIFEIALVYIETATLIISNWLAVVVAIWMFIAVQFPLRARILCSMNKAKVFLIAGVLVSLFIASPVFFILKPIEYNMYGRLLYAKDFTEYALKDDKYVLKIVWGGTLMFLLAPSIFLVICTAMLITSLLMFNMRRKKRFSNRSEPKITKLETQNYRIAVMLSVLLILFILNNLPDAVLAVVTIFSDGNEEEQKKSKKATDLLRIFSQVNSAAAFFIYYYMGENFRKTFKETFGCFKLDQTSNNNNNKTTTTSSSNAISLSSRKNSLPDFGLTRIDTKSSVLST